MIPVTFIQFLRPFGEKREMTTEVGDDLREQVDLVLDNGFRFEIEELMDGTIHMTITDEHADYYSRLCHNGPPVPANVEALIRGFDLDHALKERAMLTDDAPSRQLQ